MNGFPSCESQCRDLKLIGMHWHPLSSDTVGAIIETHNHNYDHVTIVKMGRARITGYFSVTGDINTASDVVAYVRELGPESSPFIIEKTIHHKAEILEVPYEQWCVFVERYPDGTISGRDVGNTHAIG